MTKETGQLASSWYALIPPLVSGDPGGAPIRTCRGRGKKTMRDRTTRTARSGSGSKLEHNMGRHPLVLLSTREELLLFCFFWGWLSGSRLGPCLALIPRSPVGTAGYGEDSETAVRLWSGAVRLRLRAVRPRTPGWHGNTRAAHGRASWV